MKELGFLKGVRLYVYIRVGPSNGYDHVSSPHDVNGRVRVNQWARVQEGGELRGFPGIAMMTGAHHFATAIPTYPFPFPSPKTIQNSAFIEEARSKREHGFLKKTQSLVGQLMGRDLHHCSGLRRLWAFGPRHVRSKALWDLGRRGRWPKASSKPSFRLTALSPYGQAPEHASRMQQAGHPPKRGRLDTCRI